MTLYAKVIEVPPKTPPEDPVVDDIEIEEDTITEIDVQIPYGHRGVTGLSIWYGLKQVYPLPEGSWIQGDDIFIRHRMVMRIPKPPDRLVLKAYNNSVLYSHKFYVYIHAEWWENVRPELYALQRLAEMIQRLSEALGLD